MSVVYVLGSAVRNRMSRVARPSPTSSTPVASGSSVPAWPTRRWPKMRRQRATTSCEVQPASLSTTTRPVTPAPPSLIGSGSGSDASRLVGRGLPLVQAAQGFLHPGARRNGGGGPGGQPGRPFHLHRRADGALQMPPPLFEHQRGRLVERGQVDLG